MRPPLRPSELGYRDPRRGVPAEPITAKAPSAPFFSWRISTPGGRGFPPWLYGDPKGLAEGPRQTFNPIHDNEIKGLGKKSGVFAPFPAVTCVLFFNRLAPSGLGIVRLSSAAQTRPKPLRNGREGPEKGRRLQTRCQAAGPAHAAAAKRRPERYSSLYSGFRNGSVVGTTTGVRDTSRLMIDCASASRPRCP